MDIPGFPGGGLPSFGVGGTPPAPGGMTSQIQQMIASIANPSSWKTKKNGPAAATPPPTVPTATGGFNTPQTPDQNSALLQAMIARSRAGGVAPPAPAAPPPSGGGVTIK